MKEESKYFNSYLTIVYKSVEKVMEQIRHEKAQLSRLMATKNEIEALDSVHSRMSHILTMLNLERDK